jgi:DNA-binding transcriptional LysR family regulator
MNLNQLYYFRKLAELQHFSNAAAELYISQPSLSYSIKNLEEELGASLFQKQGRNVVLTNQGKDFYLYIVEALTKLDDGITMIKKSINSSADKINIGTIPTLSGDFIPKNIRTYTGSNPQTTFDIFTCTTGKEVITGVKDGTYDIGFCSNVENEKNLFFCPILNQELVVITKAGHELSKKGKLTLPALQEYPLITYRANNPLGISIRSLFAEQRIVPNIIFAFDEEITISEMVSQDFGIAILANTPILQNHILSIIPLDVKPNFATLYLVYRNNYDYSNSIMNFILLLKSNAKFRQDY